jgi:outer membrane protein insertion porin family
VRKLAAIITLALMVIDFVPGRADEAKPVIADVVVVGGTTITPDTVEYYLGISKGDPYDPKVIQANFHRFWDSGLVENLKVEKEDLGDNKVRVIVTVRERPIVSVWKFSGNKKMSNSSLREKLDSAGVTLRRNVPLRTSEVNRARQALIDEYAKAGYSAAKVDAEITEAGGNQRVVTFKIDEGGKVKIAKIQFAGNHVYSAWRLRHAMKKIKEKSLFRWFGKKLIWNKEAWGEDSENLKKFYMDHGYKDVVVGEPKVTLVARHPNAPTQKKKKFQMVITIPVQEGKRYRMGTLTLEGATVIDTAKLLKLYETKPGKIYNYSLVEAGNEAVRNVYQSRGYIYAYTSQVLTNDEKNPDVANVTVNVYEGDRFRLGRLEFSGNTKTQEKVLRREFRLFEGQYMNMTVFRRSVFKVNQLGYFKLTDDPLDVKIDDKKRLFNVTVKGQEVGRTDIQFGAGYSQLDHFFGQFMFNTRNFLGRGETLGLSLSSGSRASSYSLSFSEPYFLDKRMVIGGSIFDQSLDLTTYKQKTKGGTALWGFSLGAFDQTTFLYSYSDTLAQEVVNRYLQPDAWTPGPHQRPLPVPYSGLPAATPYFAEYRGVTSSFTPGYFYDSRDDPFDPNQGMSTFAKLRLAGGPLGGDFDFLQPQAGFTLFHPLTRRYIVAFNVEGGIILPFNGSEIPYWERYRVGGEQSLRGFQVYEVFPRTKSGGYFLDSTGAYQGGDRYLQLNLEYQIKVGGPVKFILFSDIGNVWHEDQGWQFSNYRQSAGVELRLFLPMFQAPLRFIYARPIKRFSDDPFDRFTFSIGTTF